MHLKLIYITASFHSELILSLDALPLYQTQLLICELIGILPFCGFALNTNITSINIIFTEACPLNWYFVLDVCLLLRL